MATIRNLLITALLCGLCAGCATNPFTGKNELMLFGEEQDVELGRQYAPELEKQMGGKIPDPAIQAYVDRVGQSIAQISHNPSFEYHFVALNDKSINALALPGGYIFITRGMLENLTSEAQLAAILAHETVHVVARDVANVMSKEIGLSLLLSAATSEKTPQALTTVANLTGQIIGLRFSRADEHQADLGGLDYMVRAGYDPSGMLQTMQMLHDQEKSRPIEFLSTHPSPKNRLEYIGDAIAVKYSGLTAQKLKVGQEDYRATVLARLPAIPQPEPKPQ